MKKYFGLVVLAICLFSGSLFTFCEKERTEANMIVKNWKLVSKSLGSLDITAGCERNSRWDFKLDGTYAITDSCNNIKTGTWELAEDGKTLTLNDITAYKVIENSLIKLVIEMQVAETGLVRWTFK